jgi:anti-anti-sigma factor
VESEDLQVRSGRVAHVQFLVIAGELGLGAGDGLGAAITEAAATRPRRVVFDLSAVTFADSALVHALELATKLVGERAVVVVGARPGVARLLEVRGYGHLSEAAPAHPSVHEPKAVSGHH